jgi:hypothetical protein
LLTPPCARVAGRLKFCQTPPPEELLDDEEDPLLEDDDEEPDDDEFPLDDEDEPMPEDELLELLLLLVLLPLLLVLLPLLLLSTTDAAVGPPPPQPVSSRIARESAPYRAILVTIFVPTIRQFSARAVLMVFIWGRSSLHVTRVLYLVRVRASHFLEAHLTALNCRRMQTSRASKRDHHSCERGFVSLRGGLLPISMTQFSLIASVVRMPEGSPNTMMASAMDVRGALSSRESP